MLNKKEMGQKISELRKGANLSQTEFGKKLGYQQADISRIEKGTKDLTFSALVDIAQLFNVSADYLLGLSLYPTQENDKIGEITGLNNNAIEWLKREKKYISTINLLFELDTFQWFCNSLQRIHIDVTAQKLLQQFGKQLLEEHFDEDDDCLDEDESKTYSALDMEIAEDGLIPVKVDEFFELQKYKIVMNFDKMINEIIERGFSTEWKEEQRTIQIMESEDEINGNDN